MYHTVCETVTYGQFTPNVRPAVTFPAKNIVTAP